MFRQPFYEVPPSAYLFPAQSVKGGEQKQPEESVRQWCAYELIRAYGIRFDELEFEREVRVGSKTYRIDILVSRSGKPWIVVECKQPTHSKPDEGMAQAISYADSQGIHAEFTVYTNGTLWHVRRRVCEQWIAVPDLPSQFGSQTGEPLTEILRAIKDVSPLLHKLDETLQGDEAGKYLSAMQVFFNGVNLLTDGADRDLLAGTDDLLRVLASPHQNSVYRFGKLAAARSSFESYRMRAGFATEFGPILGDTSVAVNSQYLHASLLRMVEGAQGIEALDVLLLRLNVALTEYGMGQRSPKEPYPTLQSPLYRALRDFLNAALAIRLNTTLPDSLDRIWVGDMKNFCQPAWDTLEIQ